MIFPLRRLTCALAGGMVMLMMSGCVVADGGYGYGGADIGADYYEPYGYDYGGWGGGYEVAPYYRGGDHRRGYGGDRGAHAYRSAPASHAMPSIGSHGRPGGGHFGGGHASGGHSGGGHSGGGRSR